MLPDWVSQPVSVRPARYRSHGSFIARTLKESARLVSDTVFAERAARQPGLLQSIDARAKLFSVLLLLVVASFLRHLPSLWLLAAFALAAVALSRLGPRALINRVWWFLPSLFVLAALPAALSIFTPGAPLLVFYRAPEPTAGWFPLPFDLVITRSGAVAVMLFTTRLFIGVMLAVALALTTRWSDLLKAAYTQPTAIFVLVLTMMHRYLFVLVRTVESMHLARWSRTIVPSSVSEERRWIGGRVAVLFSRSRRLSERVYQAMLARGYQGRPRTLAVARLGPPEAAWLIACGTVAAAALLLDRSLLANLPW